MSSAAPDPWSINYFDPPTPHVPAPSPKAKTPKLVPEVDRLFQAQRNSLKVLNDLEDLLPILKGHEAHRIVLALVRDAENTYRVIRSYLADYADN